MWGRGIRRGLMRGGDKARVQQAKMNGGKQQRVRERTDGAAEGEVMGEAQKCTQGGDKGCVAPKSVGDRSAMELNRECRVEGVFRPPGESDATGGWEGHRKPKSRFPQGEGGGKRKRRDEKSPFSYRGNWVFRSLAFNVSKAPHSPHAVFSVDYHREQHPISGSVEKIRSGVPLWVCWDDPHGGAGLVEGIYHGALAIVTRVLTITGATTRMPQDLLGIALIPMTEHIKPHPVPTTLDPQRYHPANKPTTLAHDRYSQGGMALVWGFLMGPPKGTEPPLQMTEEAGKGCRSRLWYWWATPSLMPRRLTTQPTTPKGNALDPRAPYRPDHTVQTRMVKSSPGI
ncbi:hypothetical protein V8E53_004108 [Lactarius tabidus]